MQAWERVESWPAEDVAASRPAARVHVRRSGGARPIVLLHGFSDDGTCWAPVAVVLADRGWDVVLPDARGHGGTAMPAGAGFTHAEHVADAASVLDALCGAAVVVGHSMGASTAAGLAAERPDLVERLVLEDPPWQRPGGGPDDEAQDRANSFEPWLRGLRATDHAGRVAWARQDAPSWPDDELDSWAHAKARLDLSLFGAPQGWLRRSWKEVAARVRAPALLVAGDLACGSATGPGVDEDLRGLGWQVVRVPGAGHSIRRDDRGAYLDVLLPFLAPVAPVSRPGT